MSRLLVWFTHPSESIRLKVSLGIMLPLVLILGLFTWAGYQHLRKTILNQLSLIAAQAGQVIEDNLRHEMLVNDFATIQQTLNSIDESQGFEAIYLLDPSGKVRFAPFSKHVGVRLNQSSPGCQACHRLPPSERNKSVVVTDENNVGVFRSMKPIENSAACSKCHDPKQRLIGLLLIDVSTAPLEASLNQALQRDLLWWIATILVVLIVTNLVLDHFVLRPLEGFDSAFAVLRSGQNPPRLPEQQGDEIGRLAQHFNQMATQIDIRQAENQALSTSLRVQNMQRGELLKRLITAQEDERKRVARELHDELGQTLSALALHTEGILRLLDSAPERACEQAEQVKQLAVNASDQMLDLIMDLRPSQLDDLGLAPALRAYSERLFENSATQVSIQSSGLEKRLPRTIELALYRVFQEALSNVARHSQATQVTVRLSRVPGSLHGEIRDNGLGFDPGQVQVGSGNGRGLGLLGMQERVAQCGGSLEIHASPGAGVALQIHIPIGENDYD